MPSVTNVSIDFTVGSRRLLAVERQLANWSFSLEDVLSSDPDLSPPRPGPDGLRVLSAPVAALPMIVATFPHHLIGGRHLYRRHYIDMAGSFEDYLARFSGKTRSTLRRKARKLAKEVGEAFSISEHRTPAEIERFLDAAVPLSSKTYQARLLDAGLPDTEHARSAMLEAAEADSMRGFLLHADNGPIAYLSLPISNSTLVYAHLGYDPDWARLSPGTVLQMEALERLFAERRYRYFDFTEGEGAHKAMFGTDSVTCSSFVMLEPTIANRALLGARAGFDATIGQAKSLAQRSGALARIRSALRA
ncbi:MAG: GNAT family N-acetyltransferase [Erythrobacter sp.]|nr:GNAT family N-acetyltransferase [Erythrobacter sp.]